MADSIAEQVTSEKFRGRLACKPAAPNAADDDCARQLLQHYGLLLFRRPLTNDELQSRVALAIRSPSQQKDFYAGLRYGMASLIQAPDFLFRKELAVPDGTAAYTLEPYQPGDTPVLSDVEYHPG